MPTYKNNRASVLVLTAYVGSLAREIAPGAKFEAHPMEVPKSWLETPVGENTDRTIIEKVSDLPEVPEPARPKQPKATGSAKEQLQELRDQVELQNLQLQQLRNDGAIKHGLASLADASAPPAHPSTPPSPARKEETNKKSSAS